MTRASDEMRKMVEEFIKVTKINYEDQTEKVRAKSDAIEWQYHVGAKIVISKNASRPDRIYFDINMRFNPKDAKLLVMSNASFSKTVIETSQICTMCKIGHQWIKDKENIVGLRIFSHVDEQELNRVTFHNTWDNVARVSGHIEKILRSNFSGMSSTSSANGTGEKTMYG